MHTVGYSGTPLFKKLGIKAHHKVFLQNAPENYRLILGELPTGIVFLDSLTEKADVIHAFVKSVAELETALFEFKDKIVANGAIWVSWYKKASRIPTDVTEDAIRATTLALGLVDVKVCAVDEIWSGLKIVIRVKNRHVVPQLKVRNSHFDKCGRKTTLPDLKFTVH